MTQFINQLGSTDIASIAATLKGHANAGISGPSLTQSDDLTFASQLLALLEPGNAVSGHKDGLAKISDRSASANNAAVQALSLQNPEFDHLIQNLQDKGFVTLIPQGSDNAATASLSNELNGEVTTQIAVVPVASLDKIAEILNAFDPALLKQGVQVAIQQNSQISSQPEIVGSADIKAQSKQVLGLDSLKEKNALGLDTIVLFTQADGSAEAPLLEEGKVYLAPLSDVLSSSDNLSFQKTVSEKELPLLIVKKAQAQSALSQDVNNNPNVVIAQSNEAFGFEQNGSALAQDVALTNDSNTALSTQHSYNGFMSLASSAQNYSLASTDTAQNALLQNTNNVQTGVTTPIPTHTSHDAAALANFDMQGDTPHHGHDQTADHDLLIEQQLNNNFDPNAVVKEARRERSGFAQHILNNANAHHAAKANNQVAMMLEKGVNGQLDTIRLQLDPASLGKVEIEFDFSQEGHVKALIVADKQETLDILKQDARNLETILEDAGFDMDQGDLEFDLRQGQEFGQDNHFNHSSGNDQAHFDPFLQDGATHNHNLDNTDSAILLSAESILSAERVNIVV